MREERISAEWAWGAGSRTGATIGMPLRPSRIGEPGGTAGEWPIGEKGSNAALA